MPLVDADGTVREWIGMNIDITDRKRAVEDLERSVRLSEIFVGILGHDLRNPLAAISMAANLVERTSVPEEVARVARRIRVSTARMERMISQLLDFTRVRLGTGIPLERTTVNLEEVCRSIIEELESSAGREIRFEHRGETTGEWDRDRMGQLVSNLVANACQHGDPDGPIVVRLDGTRPDVVRIEVRNRGEFPQQLLPIAFEPFRLRSKLEAAGRPANSGLGLGLYIASEIARGHGGRIEATSSSSVGTCLTVHVPRRALPDVEPRILFGEVEP